MKQETVTPTVEEIQKFGWDGLFAQADVSDEAAVGSLIETAVNGFGGLDILVNNAGIHIPGDSQQLAVADWGQRRRVESPCDFFSQPNTRSPHLKRSEAGRIINIASIHAFGGGGGPAYAPAKAAVVNLTRGHSGGIGCP